MSDIIHKAKVAREASYSLAKLSGTVRDGELGKVAEAIWLHKEAILEANARDLVTAEEMIQNGDTHYDRLKPRSAGAAASSR